MEKDYNFLYEANNVYRTKNYIVKQIIGVRCSEQENNVMFSFDTYYPRTAKRNRIGAMEDDIVTTIGLEDKNLLLFDDFTCRDEGEYIGTVNADTIAQLRKSN